MRRLPLTVSRAGGAGALEAHAATLENLYSFKLGIHGTQAYYTMPHRARVHSVFCRPEELRKLAVRMTAPLPAQ